MTRKLIVFLIVAIALFLLLEHFKTSQKILPKVIQNPSSMVQSIQTVKENGGRIDWSAPGRPVVFDKNLGKNHYEVFTMNSDGSGELCVTCENKTIPHISNGNPAWDPSGKWVVFQAVKSKAKNSVSQTPGIGFNADLWIISPDGKKAIKLYAIDGTTTLGVLHPHFSPDGTKLSWSVMTKKSNVLGVNQEFGYWKLMVANFTDRVNPGISNVKVYQPGINAFYENHGISANDQWLYFTSNMRSKKLKKSILRDNDIYRLNLKSGILQQLTTIGYNEHAEISPDNKKIVWMSSRDEPNQGTDYWLMNADGTDKKRLTYFNQPGHAEYSSSPLVAADSAWSPDGKQLLVYVQTNLLKQTGKILLITFNEAY